MTALRSCRRTTLLPGLVLLALPLVVGVANAASVDAIRKATRAIDDARLRAADADTANWITHGRTQGEERFSPLDQINDTNVGELQAVWTFPTGTDRGLEATPLVVDGVLYTTGPWSIVFAVDARSGELIWKWDPKVPKAHGQKACCDVVNRGVALFKGKVFVGTLDGRLAALDAATGKVEWEVVTVDPKLPYTITGAPRVADGKILIGNGGAEFGVRGYLSAYDAESGKLVWRTYTVPGDPSKPFESKAMEAAAKTWKDGNWWEKGGAGGTVWDSMSYDPDLGLVYFGTGNGVEWDRNIRSPGGGDNLYLCSILAVDVKTGEQKWHYQTTPEDSWDYDSAQHLLLTDLEIGGKKRAVLMQAAKNGFFYVLDRKTGELLSAENYVEVTWAEKVDLATGKPVLAKDAHYENGMVILKPAPPGGHNWQPMSYSPKTGLVYIPAQEMIGAYERDPSYEYRPGAWNLGIVLSNFAGLDRTLASGHLLAWDPVKQREVWRAQYRTPWNGGTLATAGNLVFQGTADGRFVAYRATDGKQLWQAPAKGTGIIAAPITYVIDGVQYVSVSAGWGGAFALYGGDAARAAGVKKGGWVLTYALPSQREVSPPALDPDTERGMVLYHDQCSVCHGAAAVGGGVIPDLRHSNPDKQKVFTAIVKNGIPGTGMAGFGQWLSDDEIRQIQMYIRRRAEDEPLGR